MFKKADFGELHDLPPGGLGGTSDSSSGRAEGSEGELFDLVVCNPPYIASKMAQNSRGGLDHSARTHEPGPSGLTRIHPHVHMFDT